MAKAQTFKERRSSLRAKRVLSIQYRLINPRHHYLRHDWHLSTTEDMSVGGLSFYSEQEFRKGDKLEIRVVMSGVLDIYTGKVVVVRVEKRVTGATYLTAVKFDVSKRPASRYQQKTSKARLSVRKSLGRK